MSNISIKCQKCRNELASSDSSTIIDCHNKPIKDTLRITYSCNENVMENNWYLASTALPDWINTSVDEVSSTLGNWQKGKLICPNCTLRVGSFDFISGIKCQCKQFVLPQIHLVKSKVDIYFR